MISSVFPEKQIKPFHFLFVPEEYWEVKENVQVINTHLLNISELLKILFNIFIS